MDNVGGGLEARGRDALVIRIGSLALQNEQLANLWCRRLSLRMLW